MDLNQPIRLNATEDSTVEVTEKRFSMVPYAGQVIEWMGERLVLDIASVTLRKGVIPAFVDHDQARLAGEIDSFSTENNKVTLGGAFLETNHAEDLLKKKKMEYECSMSFFPGKAEVEEFGAGERFEANGQTYNGPIVFLKGVQIHECSFTYYGAVNGASAEFSKGSNMEDVMSGQGKGEPMPQISAQEVLSKMVELSGDKTLSLDCFLKGMDIETFKDRLNVALSEKNKSLSETNVELSKQVVELQKQIEDLKKAGDDKLHAGAGAGQPDFINLSQAYAKENKVSLSIAMSAISKSHPDVYAKFTGRS
jgi:hypothetical protein